MAISQELKNRTAIQFSNSTSRYIPCRMKARTQTDTCTPTFMSALCTIVKGRNNPSVYQQMMDKQSVDKQMWSMIQWDINQPGKGIKY